LQENPESLADDAAALAVTPDGRIMYWSAASSTLFGYCVQDALGRRIDELIIPPEYPGGGIFGPGAPDRSAEVLCCRRDGGLLFVDVAHRVVSDADGQPQWCFHTLTDVTQAKVAREARLLEARFGGALECSFDAFMVVDHAGRIVLANGKAAALFGYAPAELPGLCADLLLPASARERMRRFRAGLFARADAGTESDQIGVEALRKSGELFFADLQLRVFPSAEGPLVMNCIRDAAVGRPEDHRFEALLEAAPDAMVVADDRGMIVLVNTEAERLFGRSRSALIGEPVESLVPPRYRAAHIAHRAAFGADPAVRPMGGGRNLFALRSDGTEVPVEISLSPLRTPEGLLVINALRDATDHVATATRLAVHARELARSNTELDLFVHTASHDLKSPLRGINQLVTWLDQDLADDLKPETRERLRLIRTRIERMDALIADLLEYAQVGRLEDDMIFVDTPALIDQIFALLAPDKPVELHVGSGLPLFVTLRTPLEIALRNLLSNAIKHHDKARGRIAVDAAPCDDGYEFSVADDGPGIDPKFHERIFGMFQTLRPRDEMEGSGIGLALFKKAVVSVGGSIRLESVPGRGSTFRFTWPSEAALRRRLSAMPT
jgi:PAS domain S-box-containing protein